MQRIDNDTRRVAGGVIDATGREVHRGIQALVRQYSWVHTTIGIIGNAAFLIGSILFLWESTKRGGTYLFIVGAAGMFVGSVGAAMVKLRERDSGDG